MDLYVTVEQLEPFFQRLRGHAELVEDVHDTEYGMREFIVRDRNGFWITVGQPLS